MPLPIAVPLPRSAVALVGALLLSVAAAAQPPRVLVFTKTGGFRHTSIVAGVATFRSLGEAYGWAVDWTEDGADFTDEHLDGYAAVVFMSTTGEVLDSLQQGAFERYIAKGRGFVGVHAAADTEYEWPWYRGLVGRQFVQHPEHQSGTIQVIDRGFPGMAGFGDSLRLHEEWYEYTEPYADDLRYLYRVDTGSYSQRGWLGPSKMGAFHPLGWVHEYGGGRAFYTGLGHFDATFARADFRDHLAAGLHYAMTGAEEMPRTRPIRRLLGVTYAVDDVPAASAWYERALEVAPVRSADGSAAFTIGGVSVELRPSAAGGDSGAGRAGGGPVLRWATGDPRATAERLIALGAVPDGETAAGPEPGAGEAAAEVGLLDPWGNRFVLATPRSPARP